MSAINSRFVTVVGALALAQGALAQAPAGGWTRLVIAPDRSGSLAEEETRRVIETIGTDLSDAIARAGVRDVAYHAWATAADVLSGAKPEVHLPDDPLELAEASGIEKRFSVFRPVEDRMLRAAEQQRVSALEKRISDIAIWLAPIAKGLEKFDPSLEAPSTCVFGAIDRFFSEPDTLTVLITDADEFGCGEFAPTYELSATSAVVVVVVPREGEGPDAFARHRARREELKKLFPLLDWYPSSQVRPGWLLKVLTDVRESAAVPRLAARTVCRAPEASAAVGGRGAHEAC